MVAKYKLAFGENWEEQGFRNSKTAISRFPDSSIITRELIQNALDAKEEGKVEVTFELEEISLQDLPGLPEYEKAFAAAKQGKRPNEEDMIAKIDERLADNKIQVLWVVDNGKGLDSENMRTLLADGGSQKEGMAGSYGLGHLSTFPASDLNYVLYGGCSKNGDGDEQIFSGQCILASHRHGETMYSPNGYICVPGDSPDPQKRRFPSIEEIDNGLWKRKLLQIGEQGTGSFVCIAAFNGFNKDNIQVDTNKEILHAAASHFMPAIFEGKMEVRVGDAVLNDKGSLHAALALRNDENRKRRGTPFVASGRCFYSLFNCMQKNEKEFEIDALPGEKVRVRMDLAPEDGKRNIHLYRYGMWITDNVPRNKPIDFASYKPFTAIILVDRNARATSKLIAKAEGERHMQIRNDALNPADKKALKKFLESVNKEIKERAVPVRGVVEPISFVDDFGVGIDKIVPRERSATSRPRGTKKPKPRPPKEIPPHAKPAEAGPNRYVRHARALPILCTTPIVEGESVRFIARADAKYTDVEMRAVTKSGSDASCVSPILDELVSLQPVSEVNGSRIAAEDHIPAIEGQQENYVAVKLKAMKKGESEISLKMAATPPPSGVAYVIEFVSRKGRK